MTGMFVDINNKSNRRLRICYTGILTEQSASFFIWLKISKVSKTFYNLYSLKRFLISNIKHLLLL